VKWIRPLFAFCYHPSLRVQAGPCKAFTTILNNLLDRKILIINYLKPDYRTGLFALSPPKVTL
jgi:hypothetical protein